MARLDYTYIDAGKYCYPGTSVPVNRSGAKDMDSLKTVVSEELAKKQAELAEIGGLGGNYKLGHFQAFHRFLFENVFDWAGQVRTVDISDPRFVKADGIADEAQMVFLRLENEDYFHGLEQEDVAERISYYTREIDRLHPFGYGTKETLSVYFKQILGRLRYKVDYEAVSEEAWEEARAAGMDDDLSKYEEIYKAIITKIPREKKK